MRVKSGRDAQEGWWRIPYDELARRRRARAGEELRERLRAERDESALDLDPRSAYELLTRQMVASLTEELREIPCHDAENDPLQRLSTTHDADTNRLPSAGYSLQRIMRRQVAIHVSHVEYASRADSHGEANVRHKEAEPNHAPLWPRLLTIVGGLVTLGTSLRMAYGFAEWAFHLLAGR